MSTEPGHLLLVPETRPGHGLGHLQRSIALGEAWLDAGGTVTVMVDPEVAEATSRVVGAGLEPEPLFGGSDRQDAVLDAAAAAQWCVFDGYEHGADLHMAAAELTNVAVIDDDGASRPGAVDVVIDHNPGAGPARYDGVAPVVLAGRRYTLLGRAHRPDSIAEAPDSGTWAIESRGRLAVVMGGQPAPEVVRFTHAVLGRLTVPLDQVDLIGPISDGAPLAAHPIGSEEHLAPVFRRARLGLSAAGSTTWELAAAGTPAVLVSVADNQVPLGEAAAEAGIGRYMGRIDGLDPSAVAAAADELWSDDDGLAAMSGRGRALIDGRGPERVVEAMLSSGRR